MALTEHERNHAIKEAHNIAASEAYFEVRAGVVYPQPHTIFDAGFSRGWDAATAPLLEQIEGLQNTLRMQSAASVKVLGEKHAQIAQLEETVQVAYLILSGRDERIAQLEQQLAEARKEAETRLRLLDRIMQFPENLTYKQSLLFSDVTKEVQKADIAKANAKGGEA